MIYDIAIVGGGPSGLTAAIYSLRAGKKVVLVERLMPGGQAGQTSKIENYPGFISIDGFELASKMFEQATSFGLETVFSDVFSYELDGDVKRLRINDGFIEAKAVILAMGASAKELNVKNEREFLGRGVSYCATCDGNFFKEKTVAVVGGGNTSLDDVLYLSDLCKKIYLIHRRDAFRGNEQTLNKIKSLSNVELILNSVISEIRGQEKIEEIELSNVITKEKTSIKIDGLFIAIGRKPDTQLLHGILDLTEDGYIITNDRLETSIKGVFASGDVRVTRLRQIVTACSDGALASLSAIEYLNEK